MKQEDIERLAQELGADEARKVDVDRVANRVVAQLGQGRAEGRGFFRRPIPWRRVAGLRAAVAAGLLVIGGIIGLRALRDNGAEAELVGVPGLQELSTGELNVVLDSLAFEAPAYRLAVVGLDDLDESQLQQLLEALRG